MELQQQKNYHKQNNEDKEASIQIEEQNKMSNIQEKYCSQFKTEYLQFLAQFPTQQQQQSQFQQSQKLLLKNDKISVENNFQKYLQFQITETDLESYTLLLHYGNYKLKINILTIDLNENYFIGSHIANGNYGLIYSITIDQQFYAIKRIKLRESNFASELLQVYKQYFLCTLASIMKIGPKVYTPFGYDIIVTRNQAFFAMERCQNYTRLKPKKIKQQSLENLRVIHSLKFVHLDIKPANLGYSPIYRRCVFLDFGFSRLISEEIGYKTVTNFIGTLSFCSDEMRNTYFLNKKKTIDLYYNDSVGLKKTFKRLIYQESLQEKDNQNDENKGEKSEQSSQIRLYKSDKNKNIIQQSAYVFQLKFYIFINNHKQLIKTLTKLNKMPKSFYAILDNKTTENMINKCNNIKNHINKLRSQIKETKFKGSTADNIIGTALAKNNENLVIFGYQLSQLAVSLPKQHFKLLLEDELFICNIILFIDEFSKQNYFNLRKEKLILSLIKKVNFINGPKQIGNNDQIHQLISSFLRFLNSSVKQTRTYKILSTLRLLFISIQDLIPAQQIQDQIISLITDPILKCLKIIEFLLFWQLVNINNKDEAKEQIIFNLQSPQQNKNFLNLIKQLAKQLLKHKRKRYYQNFDSIKRVKKLVQSCLLCSEQKEYNDLVSLIQNMYLSQFIFEGQSPKPENQTLKIYYSYFPSIQSNQQKKIKLSSFSILFFPYIEAVRKLKYPHNEQEDERKLEYWINYIFQIYKGRLDLINIYFLSEIVRIIQRINRKKFIFMLLKILKNSLHIIYFEEAKLKSEKNESAIKAIEMLFCLIKNNQLLSQYLNERVERLNQQQLNYLFKQQELFITLLSQKKNDTQGVELFYKLFSLRLKCLMGQIFSLQQGIIEISSTLADQSYKNGPHIKIFCEILSQLLQKSYSEKKVFIENLIISFCQKHLTLEDPYILKGFCNIFITCIKINERANNYNKNRTLVEMALLHADKPSPKFNIISFQPRYTTLLVEAFCFSTKPSVLKNIYQEISFIKQQFERKYYAFFIFFMFQTLYPKHYSERQVILKQLKRTCLCLCRMQVAHSLIAKGIILIFCRQPMIVESKRKKRICSRMSIRYMQINDGVIREHINLLHLQSKGIKDMIVRQKFLKKISIH